jgi:hypothetical protein
MEILESSIQVKIDSNGDELVFPLLTMTISIDDFKQGLKVQTSIANLIQDLDEDPGDD